MKKIERVENEIKTSQTATRTTSSVVERMSIQVNLLNGSNIKYDKNIDEPSLHRIDGLFAHYHRQWWYRRQMFYHFKRWHGFLNGVALLVMAMSMVVGAVWKDSFIMIGLTALGTVIKGWNEFKNFSIKMDMCRFAYTTYEKTLIELRTYVRGLPMEEFEGFLIRMQTMDDTITDLTPPTSDHLVKQYDRKFHYTYVTAREIIKTPPVPL